MDVLTISDDEAVALAAGIERAWVAPLPTLAPLGTENGRAALARGIRTLCERGLLRAPDGTARVDDRLARLVSAVCVQPLAVCYAADLTDPTYFTGSAVFVFSGASPDERVVELVAGLGHHELATMTVGAATELLATMASAEFRRRSAVPDTFGVVLARDPRASGEALVVSPGRCTRATYLDADLALSAGDACEGLDLSLVRAMLA